MIDVSEIINDPDLGQQYTVYRQPGNFVKGRFNTAETSITMFGPVTVADPQEIQQMPEGDRIAGMMCFYSCQQIYQTHTDGTKGVSDQIDWQNHRYRVLQVFPFVDYGYYKAMAVRMQGS